MQRSKYLWKIAVLTWPEPVAMLWTMPGGRPSSYTPEVADAICEAIATQGALYKLCLERDDFPAEKTVYQWLEKYPEFRENYARARERQADRRNDEIVVIADTATDANLARLQIDARKWQASKLAPKKYGDRIEHTGPAGGPLQVAVVKFTDDEPDGPDGTEK